MDCSVFSAGGKGSQPRQTNRALGTEGILAFILPYFVILTAFITINHPLIFPNLHQPAAGGDHKSPDQSTPFRGRRSSGRPPPVLTAAAFSCGHNGQKRRASEAGPPPRARRDETAPHLSLSLTPPTQRQIRLEPLTIPSTLHRASSLPHLRPPFPWLISPSCGRGLRRPVMAYSGGGGKLSAVDAILAEAADLVALEQIAKLNTAHLAADGDSALPSSLESRFRKLKSLPAAPLPPPPPAKSLGRSATAPPHHTDPPPSETPDPAPPAPPAPAAQERRPEDAAKEAQEKENSSPPPSQAHPPPAVTVPTAAAADDNEEDLEKLFRPGRGRPTLRERNRGRDDGSPSPPRQACCFGFSPKKTLQRTPTGSGRKSRRAGVAAAADDDVLGIGDAGEWGDENRRIVTELKQQQRKLKKALEEQGKVSRETAKMAQWAKQASARMTHTAAIDDLLSDCDDEDELK